MFPFGMGPDKSLFEEAIEALVQKRLQEKLREESEEVAGPKRQRIKYQQSLLKAAESYLNLLRTRFIGKTFRRLDDGAEVVLMAVPTQKESIFQDRWSDVSANATEGRLIDYVVRVHMHQFGMENYPIAISLENFLGHYVPVEKKGEQ